MKLFRAILDVDGQEAGKMHFGMQTWGSQGDVMPFIELAKGLRSKGHHVSMVIADVGNKTYTRHVEDLGVSVVHVPITIDPKYIHDFWKAFARNTGIKHTKTIITYLYDAFAEDLYAQAERLCQNCDVLIRHFVDYSAQAAAEVHGIPEVSMVVAHRSIPTRYSPSMISPLRIRNISILLNRISWKLARRNFNRHFLPTVNDFRRRKGAAYLADFLNDVWASNLLNLVAVSPSICKNPGDWEARHRVCGYLGAMKAPDDVQMPASLTRFMHKKGKLVFITLGSVGPDRKSEELTRLMAMFCKAARMAGCRAIVQTPVIDEDTFPKEEHIYYTEFAPYAQIFPRCDVVVHHGGAGTLQLACASGTPSVVLPVIGEQYFWGVELQRIGVAPRPIWLRTLTHTALAKAITEVLNNPRMTSKAQQIALSMKNEDGVSAAVNILQEAFE